MNVAIEKAKFAYKEMIFPELKSKCLRNTIDDEKCVKEVVETLINDVCDFIDTNFYFSIDVKLEMSI